MRIPVLLLLLFRSTAGGPCPGRDFILSSGEAQISLKSLCGGVCEGAHDDAPQPLLGMDSFCVYAGAGSRSIKQVLATLNELNDPSSTLAALWRTALDYVVKVLLYSSLEHCPVVHERPYSTAARKFFGLGKRKRLERLESIKVLYDRYVVGPAMLPELQFGDDPRFDGFELRVAD